MAVYELVWATCSIFTLLFHTQLQCSAVLFTADDMRQIYHLLLHFPSSSSRPRPLPYSLIFPIPWVHTGCSRNCSVHTIRSIQYTPPHDNSGKQLLSSPVVFLPLIIPSGFTRDAIPKVPCIQTKQKTPVLDYPLNLRRAIACKS